MGHKNVPNIISLSHCLEQLFSCTLTIGHSYLCKGKEETHATMLQRRPFTVLLEEDVIFLFTSRRRVY